MIRRMNDKAPRVTREQIAEFKARLEASEREIYVDTSAPDRPEKDMFWRLYFGLSRAPQPQASGRKSDLGRLPVP